MHYCMRVAVIRIACEQLDPSKEIKVAGKKNIHEQSDDANNNA